MKKRPLPIQPLLSAALVTALAACGGGGGGGGSAPAAPPIPSAEGVYQGTTSTGRSFNAVVLEDGSIWALYGTMSNNTLYVNGAFTGTGSSNSGTYAASTTDFPAPGTTPYVGTLTGTYKAGSSFSATLTENGQSETVSGSTPAASLYVYNTPASLSKVVGTWTGGLLDGESATVTIQANGSFTGTSSLGCSFTGTLSPRASGKNVFNVSLVFGNTSCASPGQTATGIALAYPIAGGLTQLVSGAELASGASATAFFAQR